MPDISAYLVAKSDQLNALDLVGKSMTIHITEVRVPGGEQPVHVYFQGDQGKPWKPNKGMKRVLSLGWGRETDNWVGKQCTLFCEPTVKWGGKEVGGIQVSHMSDIPGPLQTVLALSKSSRKPYVVQPLTAAQRPAAELSSDDQARLLADAQRAAENGVEAFRAFYVLPEVKPHRAVLEPKLADFQKTAQQADAETVDTHPTPEQLAAAERAEQTTTEARDAEVMDSDSTAAPEGLS
ncbi:MAG: hypothetical protein AAFM92_03060 [Pseudomonadota bacterium]